MRLILIKETKEGMVLGKSIYDEKSRLLLGAGYRLKSTIIRKLVAQGYNYIYVMEKVTETVIPEDIISDEFNLQTVVCDSDSCAVEFGKMLEADRVILGTVGLIGETYSVSARNN